MAKRFVYMDHNATTPLHPQVEKTMTEAMKDFGNPSSGWPYHHTHGDNLDHIDENSLFITGSTVLAYLLANDLGEIPTTPLPWWKNPTGTIWNISDTWKIMIISLVGLIGIIYLNYLYTDVQKRVKNRSS